MATISITSNKGTMIALTADANGFVTASANGVAYVGTSSDRGVMLLRATQGEYLALDGKAAALIAPHDVAKAVEFFAEAHRAADAAARARAADAHAINMANNPDYARTINADHLSADMSRANSNN